jgi:hypothetical protein
MAVINADCARGTDLQISTHSLLCSRRPCHWYQDSMPGIILAQAASRCSTMARAMRRASSDDAQVTYIRIASGVASGAGIKRGCTGESAVKARFIAVSQPMIATHDLAG